VGLTHHKRKSRPIARHPYNSLSLELRERVRVRVTKFPFDKGGLGRISPGTPTPATTKPPSSFLLLNGHNPNSLEPLPLSNPRWHRSPACAGEPQVEWENHKSLHQYIEFVPFNFKIYIFYVILLI
jgi:hypothetical protein